MGMDRIVAVGLLTQRDLDVLGTGFQRAFPVERTDCFDSLLRAIDEAERDRSAVAEEAERSSPPAPRTRC